MCRVRLMINSNRDYNNIEYLLNENLGIHCVCFVVKKTVFIIQN